MPGRNGPQGHTRAMMAEDLEMKVDECSGLASTIAGDLDDGVNPRELRDAWLGLANELTGILTRMKRLAR